MSAKRDGDDGRRFRSSCFGDKEGRQLVRCQEMVVRPNALKSASKDRAGMFLSSPEMRIRERASTKEIFLSLPKRLNRAIA